MIKRSRRLGKNAHIASKNKVQTQRNYSRKQGITKCRQMSTTKTAPYWVKLEEVSKVTFTADCVVISLPAVCQGGREKVEALH